MDPQDTPAYDPAAAYVADTGDVVSPTAPDPAPQPVTGLSDPSYVPPADTAVPVNPDLLLPADPPYESELPPAVPYMVDVALPEPDAPVGHSADCTAAGGWCGEPAHCPPPYVGAETGAPYPPAVGTASPVGLPPVGTSLPAAPDLSPDPERDPEGHA